MRADPSRQRSLLELQTLDTTLAQLGHRQSTLPEHARLAELEAAVSATESTLLLARTEHEDVQRELRKADADVQLVRDRAERDRQRLQAGTGNAKDLQGIQHELESLARRQDVLEEAELEVMERAEAAEEQVRAAEQELATLTGEAEQVRAGRDAATADLTAQSARVAADRDRLVEVTGPDLVALYEKIRARSGSGAAPLVARRCGGCQLELHSVDLGRMRAADEDEVLRCEECGRILVRTEESGL
ncbi:MAG TPA: C4-type zinc ribbon domain-containing protein [Ornithinimicrobium sp.]|uniref:zinc ribbon domain-containing protein n=1 Tax=Ornithinimicrobium sp. TaxID=1977084 RepID=UPI002B48A556|nr:C4-type zinc ribbon domain-containing protein [Ornithinimicrobium sp.]HKJ12547.1 C4-type zinc ribbon domain-containing protein [Ornithinimicrobium sp.]